MFHIVVLQYVGKFARDVTTIIIYMISQVNIFMITVLLMYVFFFSSKQIFNVKRELKYSAINTVSTIDNRDITLAKWLYCKETGLMEIELNILNKSYDGNDIYKITSNDRKGNIYQADIVISTPTMQVVQIKDVPPVFSEIRIAISVDYGTDTSAEMVKFYTNNEQVEMVNEIITYYDLNDYYVAKLDRYISGYEKQIEEINKKIEAEEVNIQNCNNLINNLSLQKNYAAGNELNEINQQIADANKQLINSNALISSYREEIIDIEKSISDYKAIRLMYMDE